MLPRVATAAHFTRRHFTRRHFARLRQIRVNSRCETALERRGLVVSILPAGRFRAVLGQSDETTFKIVSVARRGETASQLFWADSSFLM